MTYEKRMTDAFGDVVLIRATNGQVWITDDNSPPRDAEICVADLALSPDEALKMARRLIKAAAVAYEQERELAPR